MVSRLRTGVTTPAKLTVRENSSGKGTLRGRGEMKRRAAFWSRVEKAKEVMSTAVTDFARTGRNATWSVAMPVRIAASTAAAAMTSHGRGVPPRRKSV